MQTLRFFVLLSMVLIAAAATVAMAYGLNWVGAPMWQIVMGPALLVIILAMRWFEGRRVAAARKAADAD